MATRLGTVTAKAVTRLTADVDPVWRVPLMVRIDPGGRFLVIWQRNRRTQYRIPYSAIWRLGFQAAAKAALEERRARRKKVRAH